MKSLKVDETVEALQKRIEQHETAINLMPEGRVREKLQEDVARLRSILDLKQLLAVPDT